MEASCFGPKHAYMDLINNPLFQNYSIVPLFQHSNWGKAPTFYCYGTTNASDKRGLASFSFFSGNTM